MKEDNIRNLDAVWAENQRLKSCVKLLIKLIEDCGLNENKNTRKD